MKDKIILTEQEVVDSIIEFYKDEADNDTLCEEVGSIYGGECRSYFDPDSGTDKMSYEFTPDENYCGKFGDIE